MVKPPPRTAPEARSTDVELLPLDDSVAAWPVEEVTVGDARLAVRRTPATTDDAEPALFVHGLSGSALNWTDLAGVLRDRLAIDAIDLPGHGSSQPSARSYSLDAHAEVVIGYLEQSGRGAVHLVGNSMGGAISIVVASRRPDLVRTLTLVSPAVPDRRPRIYPLKNDPRVALLVVPVLGEWFMRQFTRRVAVEARVKGTIRLCFADRSRFPKARFEEAVAEATRRMDLPWAEKAVLRSMRGLVRSQFFRGRQAWRAMSRITVPTLVLWGDTDRLVAPDLAPYVAAAIPDSRLRVLEDIGHTAMMEDPVATARLIVALLEDARDRTGSATS